MPGSPIRTPPDQRSVDSSPGPIAASHVLHRLLVPRHPPCALTHLHTGHNVQTNIKALQQKPRIIILIQDARIHYPVLKHPTNTHTHTRHQTPPPPGTTPGRRPHPGEPGNEADQRSAVCLRAWTRDRRNNQPPPHPPGGTPHPHPHTTDTGGRREEGVGPVSSGPNSAPSPAPPRDPGAGMRPDPRKGVMRGRLRCFHP